MVSKMEMSSISIVEVHARRVRHHPLLRLHRAKVDAVLQESPSLAQPRPAALAQTVQIASTIRLIIPALYLRSQSVLRRWRKTRTGQHAKPLSACTFRHLLRRQALSSWLQHR